MNSDLTYDIRQWKRNDWLRKFKWNVRSFLLKMWKFIKKKAKKIYVISRLMTYVKHMIKNGLKKHMTQ